MIMNRPFRSHQNHPIVRVSYLGSVWGQLTHSGADELSLPKEAQRRPWNGQRRINHIWKAKPHITVTSNRIENQNISSYGVLQVDSTAQLNHKLTGVIRDRPSCICVTTHFGKVRTTSIQSIKLIQTPIIYMTPTTPAPRW